MTEPGPINSTDPDTATARVLWVAAAALLVFGAAELVVLDVSWRVGALRVCWATLAGAAALGVRHATPRRRATLLASLAAVSPLLFAALLVLRQDLSGVSFAFFLATPMVFAILFRGEIGAVTTAAGSTLLVGGALFRWLPGHTGDLAAWVIGSVAAGGTAVYSSVLFRRMAVFGAQLHEERLRATLARGREALTRAEADRGALLSQVASGLAHEVNNPLAAIVANLHFLESAAGSVVDGERTELLLAIRESTSSATRIAEVIQRIKALAPDLASEHGTCEPAALLRAVVSELPRPARLLLVDSLPPSAPAVLVSDRQLRRVLRQVVQGALDALAGAPSPELTLGASCDAGMVELVITDNAKVARAPAAAAVVGANDLRARGKDSGLGVMLAGEACRRWGGAVEVSDADGGGERVMLRIPTAAPPQ